MKRATMLKKAHNDKTGANPIPYDTLDELMFDIEGRDSNYMVGLGLDDSLSQFSTTSNQSALDFSIQSSGDAPQASVFVSPAAPPSRAFASLPAPPSRVVVIPSETEGSVVVTVAGKYDN